MKLYQFAVLLLFAAMVLCGHDASGQYVWTKDIQNPVLRGGSAGAWNQYVFNPVVLYNPDSSRYEMWFGANPGYSPRYIGYATSKDRVTWTMYPTPVMSADAGTWDQHTVEAHAVVRENGMYKMWYTSYLTSSSPSYIGYATSSDGIQWSKYIGNPIMGPGTATWEAFGPYGCAVMSIPGGYKMWYGAYEATNSIVSIGYATSADGITWVRDTVHNPVLKPGVAGEWDDGYVNQPSVLQLGENYYMWYQGIQNGLDMSRSGLAVSSDGITGWVKYTANPVLVPSPGDWDGSNTSICSILLRPKVNPLEGDTLDMWYDGNSGSFPYSIGQAISPLLVDAVDDGRAIVPRVFMLGQNYPNPFNPSTTIRYGLPNRSHVTLAIYNALGQQVATLVEGAAEAGYHEVKFDASELASGVYLYRMQAGEFVQTRKLLLLQ